MNKTDRLMLIFSTGVLLISIVYTMAVVREQHAKKQKVDFSRNEKAIEQTFDVKMHRAYHEEIQGMLSDIRNLLEENCKKH